jgi:hypothetical protein
MNCTRDGDMTIRTLSALPWAVALGVLLSTTPVSAQAWDSPTFFSPRPGEDLGLYLIQPDDGGETGFAGIWRQSGNINLGVRVGLAGSDHIHVGAEFYNTLDLLGPQSGILMSWVLGLGATFNDVTALRIPLGISAGVDLGTGSMVLTPYVHPRVALDVAIYDNQAGEEVTDTDINVPVDIGVDAALGEQFVVRVGATFGDGRTIFGAGVAYRLSRRLIVR